MQTLELNKMGLAPMEQNEMQESDGGFIALVGLALCYGVQATVVGALAAGVVASFKSGYENASIKLKKSDK